MSPDTVPAPIRVPEYDLREHQATAANASGVTRASEYQWRVRKEVLRIPDL